VITDSLDPAIADPRTVAHYRPERPARKRLPRPATAGRRARGGGGPGGSLEGVVPSKIMRGDKVRGAPLRSRLPAGTISSVGPAGSGKTGLVRSLPGLLRPLGGGGPRVASRLPAGGRGALRANAPADPDAASGEHRERLSFGSERRPGELDLAHRGVLVLENLPDFREESLRALRQPLEEGAIRMARPRRAASAALSRHALSRPCAPAPAGHRRSEARLARARLCASRGYRRRAAEPIGHLFDLQCEMGIAILRRPKRPRRSRPVSWTPGRWPASGSVALGQEGTPR